MLATVQGSGSEGIKMAVFTGGSRGVVKVRARRRLATPAGALAAAAVAGLAGIGTARGQNAPVAVPNGTTDLTTLGTSATSDLTFSAGTTYSPTTFTVNTPIVTGTLDDLDATQLLTITNTGTTASTLMLSGGSNSVAPSAADLLYVATGSTLNVSNGSSASFGLVLAASGNFDVAGTATISAPISGAFAVTKTGAGTLTLSGSNSYTGGTTLTAGKLNINAAAALGTGGLNVSGGTFDNTSGATLPAANTFTLTGSATFTGTNSLTFSSSALNLGAGQNTLNVAAGTLTYSGAILGGTTSGLVKTGAGTLTINSGGGTFAGGLNVSGGLVIIPSLSDIGTGGTSNGGTVFIGAAELDDTNNTPITAAQPLGFPASTTLNFVLGAATSAVGLTTANSGLNVSGIVSGPGGLTKTGAGLLALSGSANTYVGGTNIAAGTIAVTSLGLGGAASSLGASSNAPANLLLANAGGSVAALQYSGATTTTDRGFSTGLGLAEFNVTTGNAVLTFSGQPTLSSTGGTVVILGGNGSSGGAVSFTNTASANTLAGTGGLYIISGGVLLGAGTTNLTGSTLRIGNNGPSGQFPVQANPAFLNISGGTTTTNGNLLISENNGAAQPTFLNLLGGTLNVTAGARTGGTNASGSGPATLNVSGGATFNVGNSTFTFSNATGTTTTLNLGDGTATSTTPAVLALSSIALGGGTATISLNNGALLANGSGTLIPATIPTTILGGGAVFNTSTFASTVAANLSAGTTGTGGLTKLGTGVLTLTGSNNYAGGNTIAAGFLDVENNLSTGSLTAAAANTVAAGAGLVLGVGSTTGSGTGSFTAANVAAVLSDTTFASGSFLGFNTAGGNFTYATAITAPVGFIKSGGNALTLGSANTYTGPTNIAGGNLIASTLANGGSPSSIGASSNAPANLIIAGGQLAYTGTTTTIDRGITLGTTGFNTLNVSAGGSTLTFGGPVAPAATGGSAGFQVLGGGTLVFTNATTTLAGTGNLDVTDGGLVLAGTTAGNVGSGSLVIGAANGISPVTGQAFVTLATGGAYTVTKISVGQGSSTSNSGVDTLNLTNGTILTTTTSDSIGQAAAGFGFGTGTTTAGNGVLNISGGAQLIHTSSDFRASEAASTSTINISGPASGGLFVNSGTFFIGDPGTTVVNQTGGTVATVGNLTYGNNGTATGGGTYNLGGGSAGSGLLVVGTAITKANAATPGTLNFNGGTLQTNSSNASFIATTISTNVLAGGATINTVANSPTIAAAFLGNASSPGGGLTKAGTGTLTLSGSNTFTGTTNVSAGTLTLATATTNNLPASAKLLVGSGATLNVAGVTGTGGFALASGQVLAGNGTVTGATTVAAGSTVTTGSGATASDTPGKLTTGAETWAANGTFVDKVASTTGAAGTSTGYGELVLSGLTLSATNASGSQFIVNVISTTGTQTVPAGTVLVLADNTDTSAANPFNTSTNAPATLAALTLTTTGLQAPAGFTLALGTQPDAAAGFDLTLSDVAAPEPTSLLLAGAAIAPLVLGRRRRARRMGVTA